MIVSSMHFQYKNMITKQYIKVIVRGDDENDIIFINLPISQSPNLTISQSLNHRLQSEKRQVYWLPD